MHDMVLKRNEDRIMSTVVGVCPQTLKYVHNYRTMSNVLDQRMSKVPYWRMSNVLDQRMSKLLKSEGCPMKGFNKTNIFVFETIFHT